VVESSRKKDWYKTVSRKYVSHYLIGAVLGLCSIIGVEARALTPLKPHKFFITGVSGFVGGALARALIRANQEVFGLIRPESRGKRIEGVTYVRGSLESSEGLEYWFKKYRIDVVIHLAAKMKRGDSEEESDFLKSDFFKINVKGTRNVLEAAKRARVPTVINGGSSGVYSGNGRGPHKESHKLKPPIGFYAESKLQAEELVLAANSRRMRTISLRPALVYGAGAAALKETIIHEVRSGKVNWISDRPDPWPTCYIDNFVDGIMRAVLWGKGGQTYNIADSRFITFREFLRKYSNRYLKHLIKFPDPIPRSVLSFTEVAITCMQAWPFLGPEVSRMAPSPEERALFLQPSVLNLEKAWEDLKFSGDYYPF
jgi:nucleoside-diphosphate-sugar epimerase